jgi:dTDP-4-dehydrorhamnose 3,5-epimerase
MLDVEPTAIADVKLIRPKRLGDHRGFFSEVYSREAFRDAGIDLDFVQDNHSLSASVGTLRGLHFQSAPFAQAKLVRVTRGRILDVAVDIRAASPSFGRHVAMEISAENWLQILIPVGFAHGFVTLEPDTEVLYKVSAPYGPKNDHGLAFDDPDLAIDWRLPLDGLVLSDKDRRHPRLADLPRHFD